MQTGSRSRPWLCAIAAYTLWGLSPVYFHAIAHVRTDLILVCRTVLALGLLLIVIRLWSQWPALRSALTSRRQLLLLVVSAALIAINWYVFIFAVGSGRIVQASLGYFLLPLVNVALGVIILHERLSRMQIVALALAIAGVTGMGLAAAQPPWIALLLALSFGFYGLIRKQINVPAATGLGVELLLLTPVALLYGLLPDIRQAGVVAFSDTFTAALLLLAGAVTALPLVLYTVAARSLPLSTIGMLQYVAPTLQFLLGVIVYRELFDLPRAVCFALIWLAILLYVRDLLRRRAHQHAGRQAPALPPETAGTPNASLPPTPGAA